MAKLSPRLRELGFDGIWIPSPTKGWEGLDDMGYGVYDHYDLGDKNQKNTVATRFGTKDSLLRFIAIAHANGLEVYPDIVLNHVIGGEADASAPGSDKYINTSNFAIQATREKTQVDGQKITGIFTLTLIITANKVMNVAPY